MARGPCKPSKLKHLQQTISLACKARRAKGKRPVQIHNPDGAYVLLNPQDPNNRRLSPVYIWCPSGVDKKDVLDATLDDDELDRTKRTLAGLTKAYKGTMTGTEFADNASLELEHKFMTAVHVKGLTWQKLEEKFKIRPANGSNAQRAARLIANRAAEGLCTTDSWLPAVKKTILAGTSVENKPRYREILKRYEFLANLGLCEPLDVLAESVPE